MNKYLIVPTFCFLFASQYAAAQFKPGIVFLGGSVNAQYDGQNDSSGNSLRHSSTTGLSPSLGYYLDDHSALGVGLGFIFNKSVDESDTSNITVDHSFTYTLSPFYRYNAIVTDRFGFYGRVSPSLSYSIDNQTSAPEEKTFTFSLPTRIGLYYFLFKRLSAETSIQVFNYSHATYFRSGDVIGTENNISLSFLNSFSLSNMSFTLLYYFH